MAETIAIILSFITIVLLSVFLIRFKKIFSTDKVIEKTKTYIEKMVKDINGQANRDLELIRESSNRLKALLNETEHKMEQFREASRLLQNAIAEADKINRNSGASIIYEENKNLEGIKPVRKPSSVRVASTVKNEIDPDSRYEISKPQQNSLFDYDEADFQNTRNAQQSILNDETTVMPDGAAYKHVPLIITKVMEDKPLDKGNDREARTSFTNKSDFKDQVMDLFNKGFQVEQIANELSCSITEVQFVIDMGL